MNDKHKARVHIIKSVRQTDSQVGQKSNKEMSFRFFCEIEKVKDETSMTNYQRSEEICIVAVLSASCSTGQELLDRMTYWSV